MVSPHATHGALYTRLQLVAHFMGGSTPGQANLAFVLCATFIGPLLVTNDLASVILSAITPMTYVDAPSVRLSTSDPLPRTRTALGVAFAATAAAAGYVLVLEADRVIPNANALSSRSQSSIS